MDHSVGAGHCLRTGSLPPENDCDALVAFVEERDNGKLSVSIEDARFFRKEENLTVCREVLEKLTVGIQEDGREAEPREQAGRAQKVVDVVEVEQPQTEASVVPTITVTPAQPDIMVRQATPEILIRQPAPIITVEIP